jgi:hypothetical protein
VLGLLLQVAKAQLVLVDLKDLAPEAEARNVYLSKGY